MSIGELASRSGVSTRTIRYYEELGILPPPPRSEGGTRRYPLEFVFYLRGAIAMKSLGFSLEEIRALSLWTMHRATNSEDIAEAERLVDEKAEDIHRRVRTLNRVKDVLRERLEVASAQERRQQLEATAARDASMSIGEFASRVGVSNRTVRYYEELGIIPEPDRSEGGTRRYTRDFIFYLRGALALKELGFSLDEIRLLSEWGLGRTDDPDKTARAEALVDEKMAELDGMIRLLTRVEHVLEERRQAHERGERDPGSGHAGLEQLSAASLDVAGHGSEEGVS